MEQREYFGVRVQQRRGGEATELFTFYARASDVDAWAGVRRSSDTDEGIQRVLKESRKKAITKFVSSNEFNTIPNSILLAFGEGAPTTFTSADEEVGEATGGASDNDCGDHLTWGTLGFSFDPQAPDEDRIAMVVDGQHRLRGLASYAEESGEDVPILVVALLDAGVQEQAFQFVVINNKSVRVPTSNVKSIIAGIDEDELQDRLEKAGVRYGSNSPTLKALNDRDDSPFKDLLEWDYNKVVDQRLIPLTALEQMLRQFENEFDFLEDDEDTLFYAFCAVWRAVKWRYEELWGERGKLMRKVSLAAFNEFLAQQLKTLWAVGTADIFESDSVEEATANVVRPIPPEFWTADWTVDKIQDNANVRRLIRRDLEAAQANVRLRRAWHTKLELIDGSKLS